MDDEMREQAEQIVILIRSQDWVSDGVLKVNHKDAVAVVIQAMKAAYSKGLVDATKHTSGIMMKAFDTITSLAK